MTVGRRIKLLIREIEPVDKNGRYMRENLKRIKLFLDGLIDGTIPVNTSISSSTGQSPDSFNRYEDYLVTSNGQTAFTLNEFPESPSKVNMQVNGQEMTNGIHFTVVGKNVTFDPVATQFDLEVSNEFGVPDLIIFKYVVA